MTATPPDPRHRLDELLEAALDLAPAKRREFLGRAGLSVEERERLERLLTASEAATGASSLGAEIWRQLSTPSPGPALKAGDTLGVYRLLGELGRGGMAVVYLAERADGQYHQQVALKILERPTGDAQALARFHRERQILAHLEHANIARLLDGGIAPDGRPYFVMEYVLGLRVDRYCDAERLDLRQRVALFNQIGRAVAAAHRQLVVHRDLKPSNILVAKDGTPKLLDFGIAMLLEADDGLSVPGELTQAAVPMTPLYASPEQMAGEPVTTVSDVYQLGLLLFELLVGRRAFEAASRTPREPPRPSAVVERESDQNRASQRGGVTVRQLERQLRGDLDTIVLKALRPEPDRRYESAAELVGDLERFLDGRPILARPDSMFYRLRKFCGRNRWTVGVGAASLAALLSLAVFDAARLRNERDTARREAEKAQQVSRFLRELFEAPNPMAVTNTSDWTTLEVLDAGAARLERGEDKTLAGQPVVQAEMLHTMAVVYNSMLKFERAERLVGRAVALRTEHLGADHPETLDSQWQRAAILFNLDRNEEALALHQQVLRARERVLAAGHPSLGASCTSLAVVAFHMGRNEAARGWASRAISILEAQEPRDAMQLSKAYNHLAYTLQAEGRSEEALSAFERALEFLRGQVDPEHPSLPPLVSELADVYLDLDRLDEALALEAEALQLAKASPLVHESQIAVLEISAALGEILTDDPQAALALIDRARPVIERTLGPNSFWLGVASYRRAWALRLLDRASEGMGEVAEARRRLGAAFGESSLDALQCDLERALLLAAVGEIEPSRQVLLGLRSRDENAVAHDHGLRSRVLHELGALELARGDLAAALEAARASLELGAQRRPKGSIAFVKTELLVARILLAQGHGDEAREVVAKAREHAAGLPVLPPSLQASFTELARRVDILTPSR